MARRYEVFRNDGAAGRPGFVFVRDGWSWLAFLFPALWLLWHRLWFAGAVVGALTLSLAMFGQDPDWAAYAAIGQFMTGFLVGFEGGHWRSLGAQRRGARPVAAISAGSLEEAELRFSLEYDSASPRPVSARGATISPPRAPSSVPDILFAAPRRT